MYNTEGERANARSKTPTKSHNSKRLHHRCRVPPGKLQPAIKKTKETSVIHKN